MTDGVLGRGFAFPLLPVAGGIAAVSGAAAVEQALRHILLTQPGERVGRPTFGAGLQRFLFAPNNAATRALLQESIVAAITRDERRARLLAVDVRAAEDDAARIDIEVRYTLIEDNVPMNLVFPFYLDGSGA